MAQPTVNISANIIPQTQQLEKGTQDAVARGIQGGAKQGFTRIHLKGVQDGFKGLTLEASQFNRELDRANRRVLSFGAAATIVYGTVRAFRELVSSTVEVEKSLTAINSIMRMSTRELDIYGKTLFDVARQTGQSFKETANAALEFSRQGLGAAETAKRTRDAMMLVRLTGLETTKAVQGLTAVLNTFNATGIDSTEILNKLVAADDAFAVSAGGLIEAFTRVGSVVTDAGASIDEFIGLVTAARQITGRSEAVIGNSLKTIFTRLERSSTIDDLEQLGIQVREAGGAAKGAYAIFQQLGQGYDELTREQQKYVAELAAGVFQINQFKALANDLGKANGLTAQATATAANAANNALVRNAALNNSLSTSIQNLKTSAKEASAIVGDLAIAPALNQLLGTGNIIANIFRNAKATGDTKAGEDLGAYFGESILKGIGNVLAGPGLLLAFRAIAGTVATVGRDAVADLSGATKLFDSKVVGGIRGMLGLRQKEVADLTTVNGLLAQGTTQEQKRFMAAKSVADQEAIILGILQRQVATQNEMAAAAANMAVKTAAKIEASAAAAAVVTTNQSRGIRGGAASRIPRSAEGYIPMDEERRAIAAGVGGAPRSARPVYIPGFNRGGGARGIVANTSEWIVPNMAGGGDGVFNQDMIRRFGLPPGAKPVAAGGFVSYAAGGIRERLNQMYGRRVMPFADNDDVFSAKNARLRGLLQARERKLLTQFELGQITAEEYSSKTRWTPSMYGDGISSEIRDHKPIDGRLFHVTVDRQAVIAQGLKTRNERGISSGAGLGGGPDDRISFTHDFKTARSIQRGLIEANHFLNGKFTFEDMYAQANKLGIIGRVESYARSSIGRGFTFDRKGFNALGESEKFNLYNAFAMAREEAGGYYNPWFGFNSIEGLKAAKAKDIRILEYKVPRGLRGQYVPAENEFRLNSAKTLEAIQTFAGGYIPSMIQEQAAVSAGIGGAPASARPVYLPHFDRGGGARGIVANTSEFIVPNMAGGGDAIFNQDMVRRHGLPPGARPVAAGGYIPNAAAGKNPYNLPSEWSQSSYYQGMAMGAQRNQEAIVAQAMAAKILSDLAAQSRATAVANAEAAAKRAAEIQDAQWKKEYKAAEAELAHRAKMERESAATREQDLQKWKEAEDKLKASQMAQGWKMIEAGSRTHRTALTQAEISWVNAAQKGMQAVQRKWEREAETKGSTIQKSIVSEAIIARIVSDVARERRQKEEMVQNTRIVGVKPDYDPSRFDPVTGMETLESYHARVRGGTPAPVTDARPAQPQVAPPPSLITGRGILAANDVLRGFGPVLPAALGATQYGPASVLPANYYANRAVHGMGTFTPSSRPPPLHPSASAIFANQALAEMFGKVPSAAPQPPSFMDRLRGGFNTARSILSGTYIRERAEERRMQELDRLVARREGPGYDASLPSPILQYGPFRSQILQPVYDRAERLRRGREAGIDRLIEEGMDRDPAVLKRFAQESFRRASDARQRQIAFERITGRISQGVQVTPAQQKLVQEMLIEEGGKRSQTVLGPGADPAAVRGYGRSYADARIGDLNAAGNAALMSRQELAARAVAEQRAAILNNRSMRIQGATIAASFGTAFLPEGEGGTVGGQASGALRYGGQMAAMGAGLGSLFGPAGTGWGAAIGALSGAIYGFASKSAKSFEELAKVIEDSNRGARTELENANRIFQLDDEEAQLRANGGSERDLARVRRARTAAFAGITDRDARNLLLTRASNGDAREQVNRILGGNAADIAEGGAFLATAGKARAGLMGGIVMSPDELKGAAAGLTGSLTTLKDSQMKALESLLKTDPAAAMNTLARMGFSKETQKQIEDTLAPARTVPTYIGMNGAMVPTTPVVTREVTEATQQRIRQIFTKAIADVEASGVRKPSGGGDTTPTTTAAQFSTLAAFYNRAATIGGIAPEADLQIAQARQQMLLERPGSTELERLEQARADSATNMEAQFRTRRAIGLFQGQESLVRLLEQLDIKNPKALTAIQGINSVDSLRALRDGGFAGAVGMKDAPQKVTDALQALITSMEALDETERQSLRVSNELAAIEKARYQRTLTMEGARDEDTGGIENAIEQLNAALARNDDSAIVTQRRLDLIAAQTRQLVRNGSTTEAQADILNLRETLGAERTAARRRNAATIGLARQGSNLVSGDALRDALFGEAQIAGQSGNARESFVGGFKSNIEGLRKDLMDLSQVGAQVAYSLEQSLGNAFGDFVVGAQKGSAAFRSFVIGVTGDAARALAAKGVQQLLGLAFAAIPGFLGGPTPAPISTTPYASGTGFLSGAKAFAMPGNAAGGLIHRASGGTIPAAVMKGEFIYGDAAAKRIGIPKLNAINSGTYQRRAAGGALVTAGSGYRDDVPIGLTPGSYVIRKAMVDHYGAPFLAQLASGGAAVSIAGTPTDTFTATIGPSMLASSIHASTAAASRGYAMGGAVMMSPSTQSSTSLVRGYSMGGAGATITAIPSVTGTAGGAPSGGPVSVNTSITINDQRTSATTDVSGAGGVADKQAATQIAREVEQTVMRVLVEQQRVSGILRAQSLRGT